MNPCIASQPSVRAVQPYSPAVNARVLATKTKYARNCVAAKKAHLPRRVLGVRILESLFVIAAVVSGLKFVGHAGDLSLVALLNVECAESDVRF